MTREEIILDKINRAEKKLKRCAEQKDDERAYQQIQYINGLHDMLTLLGYRAIEDESKAENVNDWWIYHYTKIEDTTGRK